MDLNTVIGFGVAVSVPVWLVLEEIASRRRMARSGQVRRKAGVASERFKRRTAPAVPRQAVSRLSA
jgi:hypothetical protein